MACRKTADKFNRIALEQVCQEPGDNIGLIELSRSFCSMNTGVEAVVCVPERQLSEAELALRRVQNTFDEMEHQFSRFRGDSELSRLNQSAGHGFKASALLYEVVAAAISSAQLTGGIFDPTILPDLIFNGYDSSFELLKSSRTISLTKRNSTGCTWRDILTDPKTLSICLPNNCSIDLGGIVKGWTVDWVSRYLNKFGNYAINGGGDIRVKGTQADASPWTVGIADPLKRKPGLGVLRLTCNAICTSTTQQRQWWINNNRKHHIIDPRTRLPAESGVISATVIASTATLAETLSKAVLILGPLEGLQFIEDQKLAKGMLVMENGQCLVSSDFPKIFRRIRSAIIPK